MNWIKQNTFEAVLLIVVIAAAIGIVFFGMSSGKAYQEAKERFDSAESSVANMERGKPFPNPQNVDRRTDEVGAFRDQVSGLQENLLKFRPSELEKVSPAEFGTRVTATSEKLRALYDEQKITYPEEWRTGFEAYTTASAKDAATPYLNFQLKALEALFTDLAKAEPSELVNVYRGKLPVETGQSMDGEEEQPRRGRSRRRGAPKEEAKPYYVMPVEITFRGRERAVREFLSAVAGSENYFTSIRSIRVRNTNESPPRTSDAEFEGGLDTGDDDEDEGFGNFESLFGTGEEEEGEEEEEVEEEDTSSEQILGQVLGAEELNVFVQLELLLFKDDVELPEIGK